MDEKLTYYNATISDMLLLAHEQNHKLYNFLEKCSSVVNPSIDTIMRTPYKDIPALAEANITRDIFDYNQRLANISANITCGNPTKMNSYLKWGLIVGGVVVSIVIGYCIYNYGSTALLKSLRTQEKGYRNSELVATAQVQRAQTAITQENDFMVLTGLVEHVKLQSDAADAAIRVLQHDILALNTRLDQTTTVIDDGIQPIVKMILSLGIDPSQARLIANSIRQSGQITQEQFVDITQPLNNISKLI